MFITIILPKIYKTYFCLEKKLFEQKSSNSSYKKGNCVPHFIISVM